MTNILQKQKGNKIYAPVTGINASYIGSQGPANSSMFHSSSMGPQRSLNRDRRKRELMKITKENQLILKRL